MLAEEQEGGRRRSQGEEEGAGREEEGGGEDSALHVQFPSSAAHFFLRSGLGRVGEGSLQAGELGGSI